MSIVHGCVIERPQTLSHLRMHNIHVMYIRVLTASALLCFHLYSMIRSLCVCELFLSPLSPSPILLAQEAVLGSSMADAKQAGPDRAQGGGR